MEDLPMTTHNRTAPTRYAAPSILTAMGFVLSSAFFAFATMLAAVTLA